MRSEVRRTTLFILLLLFGQTLTAYAGPEGVLARCGASKGQGYFFHDSLMNPEGPNWDQDGISNGKIVLIKLGDEWDIQFGDAMQAYGYRQDGAVVMPLSIGDGKLTIGAFHNIYSDIYTFDFRGEEVVWTSHKLGPIVAKVAIYKAVCSFVSPEIEELSTQ